MAPLILKAVLIAATCLNEVYAAGTRTRLLSMPEVMAKTTIESAAKILLEKSQKSTHGAQLAALIQDKFGQHAQGKGKLRAASVRAHGAVVATTAPPKGYAAVGGATAMLNEMLSETNTNLDMEELRCKNFDTSTLGSLSSARQGVSFFNGRANQARGKVLYASGEIQAISAEVGHTQEMLAHLLMECEQTLGALQDELAIVVADMGVMEGILNMTQCEDEDEQKSSAASFFQKTSKKAMDTTLVQCAHCNAGNGMVMLQSSKVQSALNKLKSSTAHAWLQRELKHSYKEASRESTPVALTQVGVQHMTRLARGASKVHRMSSKAHRLAVKAQRMKALRHLHEKRSFFHAINKEPDMSEFENEMPSDNMTNISDVPEEAVPADCTFTNKCTLSAANCEKLQDRFMLIQSGITDKRDELLRDIAELQQFCEDEEKMFNEQLSALQNRLGEQQTNLATATGDQNEAESGSHLKAGEFDALNKEYHKEMAKCCDNQNNLMSERCALTKIRGELKKLEGTKVFITDCEVSEWQTEACDKQCDGGSRKMTRSVLVHPMGGMECPVLEATETCNSDPCAVDCVVEDWSGWSECSAECDGGVLERSRQMKVEARNGGLECPSLTETENCNMQACNKDCVLADWGEWGTCNKFCDGGHARRHRTIAEEAIGTGTCPEAEDDERTQFKKCNEVSCNSFLNTKRRLFTCENKVDVIVLLDGSGSLGMLGWIYTKSFAKFFLQQLHGSPDHVNAALLRFSGARNLATTKKCLDPNANADLDKECNIKWISSFTNDTFALSKLAYMAKWPKGGTLTSMALAEAEAMIPYGREDAETLIVVVTDGKPWSNSRTTDAANRLKKKAKLVWVPVGANAPLNLVQELASKPKEDHVVQIDNLKKLRTKTYINKILLNACSKLSY